MYYDNTIQDSKRKSEKNGKTVRETLTAFPPGRKTPIYLTLGEGKIAKILLAVLTTYIYIHGCRFQNYSYRFPDQSEKP